MSTITAPTTLPVVVAGNKTVHAGRKVGTYDSGQDRFAKLCGGAGRDRHDPHLAEGAEVTCKRCLAKVADVETNDDADATQTVSEQDASPLATLDAMLIGAGIPRAGQATIAKTLDEIGVDRTAAPTDEQKTRLLARMEGREKAGLTGKSAIVWIVTGQDGVTQTKRAQLENQMRETSARGAAASRRHSSNSDASEEDRRAAELANEASAAKGNRLSQRVTPAECQKARRVLREMFTEARKAGAFPNAPNDKAFALTAAPAVLGFTSERAMKTYIEGALQGALPLDARTGIKALRAGIGSHQCWARKAGAAAFGVMLQTRETAK